MRFSQEVKSPWSPDKPEAIWRSEDWADIAATEESGEFPDEMIQDLQNALERPNDLARFVTQRPS